MDLGRVFFDPATSWSINWLVDENQPVSEASYLGVAIQELSYRALEPSNAGPRLTSLFGAVLAGTVLLFWLKKRKTPLWAAFIISAIFLLDPIFNESYRQGRLDSWAFATILTSCLLLRTASEIRENKGGRYALIFFSGLFIGIAPFIWPTSLALFPLVAIELLYCVNPYRSPPATFLIKAFPTSLVIFFLGCILSITILLVPIVVNFELYRISISASATLQHAISEIQHSVPGLYTIYDPLILPAVGISLLIRRDLGLILAFTLALAMIFQTMIYPMRILYLLPYFAAFLAGAYSEISQNPSIHWRHAILFVAISSLLLWNTWVTLIERPLIANNQKSLQAPNRLKEELSKSIGRGDFKVLLVEFDIYFAARELGWDVFKVYGRFDRNNSAFKAFLDKMDFVIIRDQYLFSKEVTPKELSESGFRFLEKITFSSSGKIDTVSEQMKPEPTNFGFQEFLIYTNSRTVSP